MNHQATHSTLHGMIAEFETPEALLQAATAARKAGYTCMDAYSPFPIHGLSEAMGYRGTALPFLIFLGGVVGGLSGFGLQYWVSVVNYPLNVGGKPFNSWPAFIPVIFELTVLCAALTAVVGMLALNGLPKPYHPTFNVDRFARASQDRFFLCLESRDPKFDGRKTREFLQSLGADDINEVEE